MRARRRSPRGLSMALPELVVLREPGGAAVSERVRALVADPALEVDPRAEALLFAAARAQLVARGGRAAAGRRALGGPGSLRRLVAGLPGRGARAGRRGGRGDQRVRVRGLRADLTLYVRVAPEVARGARGGGGRAWIASRPRAPEFFARVVDAYDALAAAAPERYVVLDGSDAPETVVSRALAALKPLQ